MFQTYCHICNQPPPVYLMTEFCAKVRILKLGTKNTFLSVFGSNFKNLLSYLKSASFNFPYCNVWDKKTSFLWTKNARFAYFRARIWIHSYNIWNQNLWICLFGKYHEIMKMSKYRMKNTCDFQILLMCLKSAPSNLSNAKFCEKK